MKKILTLSALLLACFCYQACYEDKGKYDYLPVNQVTVAIPAEALTAYLGDTLKYTPKITFEDPADTLGFEYWWEYKGASGLLGYREIVNEGRELKFVPRIVGSQLVQLCVREISSGFIKEAGFTVNASSRYARGWLILREEAGKTKLSYVLPERSIQGDRTSPHVYTPYVDLYTQLYPDVDLGSGPVALRQAFSSKGIQVVFYILQENGSACFNGISYQREVLLSQEFIGGPPANLKPIDYMQMNYVNMLLNEDHTVYYRAPYYSNNTDFFTYSFANFPMAYQGKVLKVDRLIPCIAEYAFFTAAYDKENKRFLWIYAGQATTGGGIMPATSFTLPGEYLDYNNTADANILYTAFYNESLAGSLGQMYNITVYERGGNYYVQHCRGTGGQLLATLPAEQPLYDFQNVAFPNPGFLAANTKFYQMKTRAYLFFATGNNLYWYDHLGKTARLFYTLPAGSEVVAMSSNPQESELGVACANGKFIILDVANNRLMENDTKLYEIDLPGRVVDMDYKFPDYATHRSRTSSSYWD
ncbi:MAG: hypothetical protein LBG30_01405 [Odoribacteraceae bacterium]|jgi:hypothetical protein|nr:hypothetical protein [Odoribacteraceae bacterium]